MVENFLIFVTIPKNLSVVNKNIWCFSSLRETANQVITLALRKLFIILNALRLLLNNPPASEASRVVANLLVGYVWDP